MIYEFSVSLLVRSPLPPQRKTVNQRLGFGEDVLVVGLVVGEHVVGAEFLVGVDAGDFAHVAGSGGIPNATGKPKTRAPKPSLGHLPRFFTSAKNIKVRYSRPFLRRQDSIFQVRATRPKKRAPRLP